VIAETQVRALPDQPPARQLSGLVYGDVRPEPDRWVSCLGAIHGPGSARAGCAVTLVVKAAVRTRPADRPLLTEPGVTVRRPHAEHLVSGLGNASLSAAQASGLLAELDQEHRYDLVVLAAGGWCRGRGGWALSPGRTDLPDRHPASVAEMTEEKAAALAEIAAASGTCSARLRNCGHFWRAASRPHVASGVLMPPVRARAADSPQRPARTRRRHAPPRLHRQVRAALEHL